ncbi:MAG: Translation initiation factor IF-2 [uncultured bacterium]|nr:MAG: Translation initiation factor IF-2 [uncultured bacterium]
MTESDVMMAAASQGLVIGFHTQVPPQVERMAERLHTEVVVYKIIYKLLEDLKKLLLGLLEPEVVTVELGTAKVLKIFFTGKGEMVVGCKIESGKAQVKAKTRVQRGEEIIGEGLLEVLKLVNEEVKELEKGSECGIKFKGKFKLEEGDILQFYKFETHHKTL